MSAVPCQLVSPTENEEVQLSSEYIRTTEVSGRQDTRINSIICDLFSLILYALFNVTKKNHTPKEHKW